jgi:flagellar motor protein MotB
MPSRRTPNRRTLALLAVALISLSGGCQDPVANQRDALYQQNQQLQLQLTDAQNRLKAAPDPGQVAQMQSEIAARDARIADLQNTLRQPTTQATSDELSGIQTAYDPSTGNVTVTLPNDILFDPGQATLKQSSNSTLDKIAAALAGDYADKPLFVDGHTDTDPISHTKAQWADNRDLSYARAKAVTTYLMNQGVDGKRIVIRAFGENEPKATKKQSRRVEIVVVTK